MKIIRMAVVLIAMLTPLTALNQIPHDQTLDCLAEAVWREAGNQGVHGKRAVAQVVLNRVSHPHYPDTVCGVVFQPHQFSWTKKWKGTWSYDQHSWKIAGEILIKPWTSFRATHFHNHTVNPNWGLPFIATIGDHTFYEHKKPKTK